MSILIATVFAALAAGADLTPDEAAYARLPVCKLSADGQHLAVEPCRTAPSKRPMPRRPVPQFTDPMPRLAQPHDTVVPAPLWAPTLTPSTPASAVAAAAAAQGRAPVVPTLPALTPLPGPSAPTPVTCSGGGCRDSSGNFYNAPPGQAISPSGRPCSVNGVWMSCQ
ncbi:hypothetical protein [Pseudoduganella sp. RAF53_2]|uniref:hypothetical protein n=1 Tax=unclassified Pseudoduganella TaxID=2637179 RepID=UPI003F9A534E